MNIYTSIKNLKNIKEFNSDGIIINTKYSTYGEMICDNLLDVIKICQENHKKIILKIDRIIEECELNEFYNYLDNIINLPIDYYLFSDWSCYIYFKNINKEHKLIYYAPTLVCNYLDINEINNLGLLTTLSNEQSLDELITNTNIINTCIIGLGYIPIYYSKRKLLSLNKKYHNKDIDTKLYRLEYIKEETREEKYPIYQNDYNSIVFAPNPYVITNELEKLHNKMIFLLSDFLDEQIVIDLIELYKNIINKTNNIKLLDEHFKQKYPFLSSGFLYKKLQILEEE